MNISELARTTGVSTDRLRHYDELGLINAARSPVGYRIFSDETVREVHFIAKCRDVDISLKTIAKLMPDYRAGTLTFDDMIDLMGDKMVQVDQQISDLKKLRNDLSRASAWFAEKKKDGVKRTTHKSTT